MYEFYYLSSGVTSRESLSKWNGATQIQMARSKWPATCTHATSKVLPLFRLPYKEEEMETKSFWEKNMHVFT